MAWPGDLRRSVRTLRRRPGFTAAVVLTLGLGIGLATAMFSVVDGVLLRPLPYADADRLLALFTHELGKASRSPSSPADFLAWKRESRLVDEMTAAHPWSPVLTGRGPAEAIQALKATPGLFSLLGAEAALGQVFREAEDGAVDVVVLGHGLWQRRFGADPAIVGATLALDGKPYVVAGVMPEGFRFPPFWAVGAEMWTPLRFRADDDANDARFLRVFGRRAPGVGLAEVRAEMDLLDRRLRAARPDAHRDTVTNVEPLHEPVVSRARPALLALLGAAGFVLLIAGANGASLLLARGLGREKEIAVRSALGAGRPRLVGLVLAECTLLALAGGLLGVWLAHAFVQGLRVLGPPDLPRLDAVAVDARVLAFALGLSILTGITAGLLPALRVTGTSLVDALKRGGRAAGAAASRPHDLLVVGEFALALVLLAGAGLMGRSVLGLLHPAPGFRTGGLLTLTVAFSGSPVAAPERQGPFLDAVLDEVRRLPGVDAAALVNHLPVGGDTWSTPFEVDGTPTAEDTPSAVFRVASPGYLEAAGIALRKGRDFDPDDRAAGAGVVLVNETLARRFFPGGDAVGGRLRRAGGEPGAHWLTVVGVFADARQSSLVEPVRPELVFPYAQNPVPWFRSTTLLVAARGESRALTEAARASVARVAGDVPVTARGIEAVLADSFRQERFAATLAALFGAAALGLAAIGVGAVMAQLVSLRAREIAIRMALGARAGEVFRGVIGRGVGLAASGIGLGLPCALVAGRGLSGLIFGVSPHDPLVFAGVTLVLILVASVGCAVPGLRAARVAPLVLLRDE